MDWKNQYRTHEAPNVSAGTGKREGHGHRLSVVLWRR